jgi:hypothetical protein
MYKFLPNPRYEYLGSFPVFGNDVLSILKLSIEQNSETIPRNISELKLDKFTLNLT